MNGYPATSNHESIQGGKHETTEWADIAVEVFRRPMHALLSLVIVAIQPAAPIEDRRAAATEVFHCNFDDSWDKNFDAWPDQWTRRRGQGFPGYVKVRISDEPGPAGGRSLRIDLDGAGAGAYSPALRAGPLHAYLLEGWVRTEKVRAGRAWISLTLLDDKRRPLEHFASDKLEGAGGWKKLRLGPVSPASKETRLAIIGLHVEPGPQLELDGSAWFADLWLGHMPRVSLTTTPEHRVLRHRERVTVTCHASGFSDKDLRITFYLEDASAAPLAQGQQPLSARRAHFASAPDLELSGDEPFAWIGEAEWTPPIAGPGFYRVRVAAQGRSGPAHCAETTLAVVEPRASMAGKEFGWSLPGGGGPLPLGWLAPLVVEAGVGRVKLPLWVAEGARDADLEKLAEFIQRLAEQNIEVVGLLDRPPPELRDQLDPPATPQAADVLSADPKTWQPALAPVLTRLAGQVRSWQFGGDEDDSLVSYPRLAAHLGALKTQMDRAAYDASLGIPWRWKTELPQAAQGKAPCRFVSLWADPPLEPAELAAQLEATRHAKVPRWVALAPLPRSRHTVEARILDLVEKMLTCKVHDAAAIFLAHPFSTERGVMNDDGTPGELFLPWRTTALMLAGSRYLGTIEMAGASRNLLFGREGEAILVAWNAQPCREVLYLGRHVRQTDVWGRAAAAEQRGHDQVLSVGPLPVFVTGLDPAISRWRMEANLEPPRIPSIPAVRHANRLRFTNTFSVAVSGTARLVLPAGWTAEPPQVAFRLARGESVEQPFEVTLPYDTCCGRQEVRVDFELRAEDRSGPALAAASDRAEDGLPCRFSVYRRIEVGQGDVRLEVATRLNPQGELEVLQRVINETSGVVSLACELFAPARRRQKTEVAGLGPGRDEKTYRLPGGKELLGKTLWLRAQQVGGPRVLNCRITAER